MLISGAGYICRQPLEYAMYNRPIMTELCAVQVTVVRHGDVQGSTAQLFAPNSLAHSTGAATQCLVNA